MVYESSEGFEERTRVQIEPYGRFRVDRVLNEQDIGNGIHRMRYSMATVFDSVRLLNGDWKGHKGTGRLPAQDSDQEGRINIPRAQEVKGQLENIILKHDSISGDCLFTLPSFSLRTTLYQRHPNTKPNVCLNARLSFSAPPPPSTSSPDLILCEQGSNHSQESSTSEGMVRTCTTSRDSTCRG
jgi:hypothetical protein